MKISFLSFYSGHFDRGVEVATSELAKRLAKNHETHLFQTGSRKSPEVNTTIIPVKINWDIDDKSKIWMRRFYLDYWSRKIFIFTINYIFLFLKDRPDVVIPTNGGWQVVVIRLLTWLFGKKMIVQGNAGIGYDDRFQLYCLPDHYIAISPNGYRWSSRFVPWVKKSYIPYGVDLTIFNTAKPAVVPLQKPIVLCVAAFLPYKQIGLLIAAMEKVPDASLLVIGQGVLEQELRTQGKRLLGTRFLLKVGISHDELIGYYKAARVFSLPSKASEAFGIVYIEAMAAGLTNVVPDDWRKEIIGQAGYFVDPTNEIAYANAIKNALKNPLKDKALAQAKLYSWDHIVEKYENLLQSV